MNEQHQQKQQEKNSKAMR